VPIGSKPIVAEAPALPKSPIERPGRHEGEPMLSLQRLTGWLKAVPDLLHRGSIRRPSERDVDPLHRSVSLVLQSLSNQDTVTRENRRLYLALDQRLNAMEQRSMAADANMARLEQRIDALAKRLGAGEQAFER
jgi:hypothetical protein